MILWWVLVWRVDPFLCCLLPLDFFWVGEPHCHLPFSGLDRVWPVNQVAAGNDGVVPSDGSRSGWSWVCGPHHCPNRLDDTRWALPHHGHYGPALHVANEARVERPLRQVRVMARKEVSRRLMKKIAGLVTNKTQKTESVMWKTSGSTQTMNRNIWHLILHWITHSLSHIGMKSCRTASYVSMFFSTVDPFRNWRSKFTTAWLLR